MMERRKNLNDKFGFVEIMEVSLNEIGEIITGNTPSKSDTNFWNSPDICFIKPDVIAEDEITELLDSNEYISENARNKARIVNENSILVTCIGSIAKIGIVKIRECAFNQQINAIIPNKNIDTKYLCYCLQNSKVKLKAIANAPVVPIINKKQFGEFVVKIDGDISTQKKIVNRLDYIQSVITLYKIQLQKFDDLIKARFIEMFGDPVLNERKFPTLSGADFFKLSNGRAVPDEKRIETGIPAYGGNGISWYTDEFLMAEDTIVVGRVGFQSGNVHYVIGPLWITDNAMYISQYDKDKFNLRFLCELMQHVNFSRFQDAGDLKKITQKPFMTFKYILPSMDLQQKFVNFKIEVDKSRFDIKKSITELEREVVYD